VRADRQSTVPTDDVRSDEAVQRTVFVDRDPKKTAQLL
jgi:hypothetical protein